MKLRKNCFNHNDGFIVPTFCILFSLLEKISLFYLIRKAGHWIHIHLKKEPNRPFFIENYIFPDLWVLGNVIFSVYATKLIATTNNYILVCVLCGYAILRIFEMFVYQINVLFFHKLKNRYIITSSDPNAPTNEAANSGISKNTPMIQSATRTVIILLINMIEYIFQFVTLFAAIAFLTNGLYSELSIAQSFELFTNLALPADFINKRLPYMVYGETLIGMFMNIFCFAHFVGMLPHSTTSDKTQKTTENSTPNKSVAETEVETEIKPAATLKTTTVTTTEIKTKTETTTETYTH